ncbi:MAG: hypothetical protein WD040_07040 [Anaerolineales bacterium]
MDLHLVGEGEAPVPPEQVRFRWAQAEPYPDRQRVRIEFELTPFLVRPDVEIEVQAPDETIAASASIIENVDTRVALTLHLRGEVKAGTYQTVLKLSYREQGLMTEHELKFEIE